MAEAQVQGNDSAPARTYKITVCRVCGLEAPYECEHMREMLHEPRMPNVYRSIEVVPRDVAERLAEALATIAADTDLPGQPEDPARGLAWRVRLAHETEREFRAEYPEKAEEEKVAQDPEHEKVHRAEEA